MRRRAALSVAAVRRRHRLDAAVKRSHAHTHLRVAFRLSCDKQRVGSTAAGPGRNMRVRDPSIARMQLPRGHSMALAPVILLASAVMTGCGGKTQTSPRPAPPQTIQLGWHQTEGRPPDRFLLTVSRLVIGLAQWSVHGSVQNQTGQTWLIERPHMPGGTKFGIFVFKSGARAEIKELERRRRLSPALIADTFVPELPRILHPGVRWTGVFSGRGTIPSDRFLRIAFGRFTTQGEPPKGLYRAMLFVTDRAVRMRPS